MSGSAFPELVLFDLDGTLLDSAPDMVATVNRMRAARGQGPMALDELRPHVSKGSRAMSAAAFALAIVGAEYVARLLPKGTHQYRDFIRPSELARWLREAGLDLEDVSGLVYEPWRNGARLGSRTDVNYLACALKPDA